MISKLPAPTAEGMCAILPRGLAALVPLTTEPEISLTARAHLVSTQAVAAPVLPPPPRYPSGRSELYLGDPEMGLAHLGIPNTWPQAIRLDEQPQSIRPHSETLYEQPRRELFKASAVPASCFLLGRWPWHLPRPGCRVQFC